MDRFARGLLEEPDFSAEGRVGQSSNLRLSELGIERRISSTSRACRETDAPDAAPQRQAESQHERNRTDLVPRPVPRVDELDGTPPLDRIQTPQPSAASPWAADWLAHKGSAQVPGRGKEHRLHLTPAPGTRKALAPHRGAGSRHTRRNEAGAQEHEQRPGGR
jgi:hypothetical protein